MGVENSSDENQWRAIRLVLSALILAAAVIAIGQYVGVEKRSGPQADLSPQVLPSPQKLAIPRSEAAHSFQTGDASWYAFNSRTASGEQMDASAMTAAHPSLPYGTQVLVENLSNGRSVVVRINDRGPFTGGRIIDLSQAAAASIGMIDAGVVTVRVSSLHAVLEGGLLSNAKQTGE